jgi:23S rRNA pseudouridine2605 synthase
LTSEQLELSRSERLRLNGNGALTLEDARTWIEETGLCLFLPRRQFSVGVAPSFVEAVGGHRNPTPDPKQVALAEELLVRLELDGVAVRLNLLGQPGEQPDFVVAAWVLPYVYALRGDRDWRRSPQLTGSRQVSPLAIQAYKLLEAGDATIPQLKHTLGKEVTEMAVLRAITELWQQLRIIPVISAPGKAAQWQLLRHRFQKAIAEGASTSQVTAISVLASIYLQAVIAASMEEVELFLAPLTARSKVREVLRGLVATRQVHTLSLGHAPHFYVAGTLPEFSVAPTIYASSAMAASAYFLHAREYEEEQQEHNAKQVVPIVASTPVPPPPAAEPAHVEPRVASESHAPRVSAARKPAPSGKSASARPHFSRPAARTRDRKPAQTSSASRPARRPNRDARPSSSASRPANGTRHASNGARWNGGSNGNGHSSNGHANGHSNGHGNGHNNGHSNGHNNTHANGNGHSASRNSVHSNGNGHGNARNGAHPAHPGKGASSNVRNGKPSSTAHAQHNGRPVNGKASAKPAAGARKDARGGSRKPALTAGAKAGNTKRFGFTAPGKRGTKKRG